MDNGDVVSTGLETLNEPSRLFQPLWTYNAT